MIFGQKSKRRVMGQGSSLAWQQFRNRRSVRWSLRILVFLLLVSFFADFIANDKPLYCKLDGQHQFPILQDLLSIGPWADGIQGGIDQDWYARSYESVVWPIIPYGPTTLDLENSGYANPFEKQRVRSIWFHHWLGTNQIGHDLLAGLIHGTRTALLIGILAMLIASFIGILLGGVAGFFGDDDIKLPLVQVITAVFGIIMGLFWGFGVRSYELEYGNWTEQLVLGVGVFLLVGLVFNVLGMFLGRLPLLSFQVTLPIDLIVMRIIELFNAMPNLLLLLAIISIVPKPSVFTVVLIIGFLGWTGIARFVRAEILRIRNLEYIEAGRALGFSRRRLLFRHALPNAVGPVLVAISFGVAGAVLAEATLSFIGIGVPAEEVTWGRQLYEARSATKAWWLAFFPGLAIFVTVTIFNLLGEGLSEAMRRSA